VDNIEFIKEVREAPVSRIIADRLNELTEIGPVLWLVAGGSAAGVANLVSRQLDQPENLIVSLTDERYGPAGHRDSNWRLLIDKGFDFPPQSYAVLFDKNFNETTKDFNNFLAGIEHRKLYKTALFGMGLDGHIAGILPGSPAIRGRQRAVGYQGPDYTRLTITDGFVSALDEAFVYARGAAKHAQIKKLKENVPAAEQPAQLLKKIPWVRFFNDLHG
jgi:6-phosphogluconolactonase/glucosamine-6-phosphate isomerase/deaminase